ncbi:MAG: hypothetical protein ACPKPY_08680 [Nitrososphaeraceae archaeon]
MFVWDNIVNVTQANLFFECDANEFFDFPATPDSPEYVSCDTVECPGIDESDFGVSVLKDAELQRIYLPQYQLQ